MDKRAWANARYKEAYSMLGAHEQCPLLVGLVPCAARMNKVPFGIDAISRRARMNSQPCATRLIVARRAQKSWRY